MKKVPKPVYCSRCGDEISPAELITLEGSLCALCANMHLEAQEIHRNKRKLKPKKPGINRLHLVATNPQ
ncbi:hypothetical protein [Methylomonas sp. MgM2]